MTWNFVSSHLACQPLSNETERGCDAVTPDLQSLMEVARSTGNRLFAVLMAYLVTSNAQPFSLQPCVRSAAAEVLNNLGSQCTRSGR